MTGTFILTPSASRDLDSILEYVLEHSGAYRALHVQRKLHEGMRKIGEQPLLLGHARTDLGDESIRVFVVFSYLIIFRPQTSPVQVIRVLHGARDIPNAMTKEQ